MQGVACAARKGINLKQLRLVTAATVVAVLCVSASALAAPYSPPSSGPAATAVPTVFIKGGKSSPLRFEVPKTIVNGELA